MKILLEVKDDKTSFLMELLNHFKFVKAQTLSSNEIKILQKKQKEAVIAGIKESVQEMKQIKAGRKKVRPIEELIREL